MTNFLHNVALGFGSLLIAIGSIFAPAPAPASNALDISHLEQSVSDMQNQVDVLAAGSGQTLGSTNAIETPVALFQTTLTNSITAAATSMTLTSGTTKDGTTLASSTYSFIIDEGTASEEFVKADCTNTTCTNMSRGLSVLTGTSSVSGLAKSHRRGASVKITDAPILLNLTRILNGIGTIPNVLSYTTEPTFTIGTQIIDKTYADNLSFAGAPNSSETVKGISELATPTEQAAGTSAGSTGARLVIAASNSTSTCQFVQASNIIASSTTGKLDKGCFDQSAAYTLTGGILNTASSTNTATTSIAASNPLSKALILNGVPYAWPTTQGTANSYARNDGSGNISFSTSLPKYSLYGTGLTATNAYATSSAINIPANTLTASSTIYVTARISSSHNSGTNNAIYYLRTSTGVTLATCNDGLSTNGTAYTGAATFSLVGNQSATAQASVAQCYVSSGATNFQQFGGTQTSAVDFTQALGFVLVVQGVGANDISTMDSYTMTVTP